MSCRFADSLRAGSGSCLQAVSKPVRHIQLLCVQWKTPDDGQRNCPKHVEFYSKNISEKLVHLVGFITRIYHDARSPERQTGFQIAFSGNLNPFRSGIAAWQVGLQILLLVAQVIHRPLQRIHLIADKVKVQILQLQRSSIKCATQQQQSELKVVVGSLCYTMHWLQPIKSYIYPLNAELNPICHLLALLGAHHILHVSRVRVKRIQF